MNQKAKSRQEIAQEYGISARTLCRWIKKNQLLIPNGLISPKDQDQINKKFRFQVPQKF
jgi:hypothetical protein